MTALSLTLLLTLAGRPAHLPQPGSAPPAEQQPALSDTEVESRVETYLGAIDTPITAEQWKALGPAAVAPLGAVAQDPQALPTRRAKALTALSLLGGSRAQQVVVDTARSEQAPFAVRASALRAAGRLLGPKALQQTLSPVLQRSKAAPVRAVAAEVLASRAGASGCAAVRAQVAREPGAARGHFARALQRCDQAAP